MRHGKKVNHLGRTSAHRQAMLANMAVSLILSKNKRIFTTLAKAKALRVYVEPLITRSKEDSTNSRRVVFGFLQSKDAVNELFRDISVKIAQRPGGYTRILKTGMRQGDNADMCMIELVDYNENLLVEKQEKKTKTTRRSRRGTKNTTTDNIEGSAKVVPSETNANVAAEPEDKNTSEPLQDKTEQKKENTTEEK